MPDAPALLVTGFGPFPGMARNPSAAIARLVAASPRWRRLGMAARSVILAASYAELDRALAPGFGADAPQALLMVGVAGRSRRIRLERRAVNRVSLLVPDAAGRVPRDPTLGRGPMVRITRAAPERLQATLRRRGVSSSLSQDAGRYLCNAAYYQALAGATRVLFVHIPNPPRLGRRRAPSRKRRLAWHDSVAAGLVDVALQLLVSARAEGSRGGG